MAITQISRIKARVGDYADLPVLASGELGYATDQKRLFVGNPGSTLPSQNTEVLTKNVLPLALTTDLQSISSTINTVGKTAGLMAFNTTNNLIYIAGGGSAGSSWYPSNGGATITPV